MKKFMLSIITGIIIGAAGLYLTLDWQEEKMIYKLSEPAQFGEITYQNMQISNNGWNPATNVIIYLSHPSIKQGNIRTNPEFNIEVKEKNAVGGFNRIRRDESVTITFAYKGQTVEPSILSIKSDRSIAKYQAKEDWKINFSSILVGIAGFIVTTFFIGMVAAIVIPNYLSYKKRALEHAEKSSNNQVKMDRS